MSYLKTVLLTGLLTVSIAASSRANSFTEQSLPPAAVRIRSECGGIALQQLVEGMRTTLLVGRSKQQLLQEWRTARLGCIVERTSEDPSVKKADPNPPVLHIHTGGYELSSA